MWPIGRGGLLHDREWMIVTSGGVCLNQKRQTKLALIRPSVDRERGVLTLDFPGLNFSFLGNHLILSFRSDLSQFFCPEAVGVI